MSEWIKMEDGKPPYGGPVLIKSASGTVQHIIYCLDGADNSKDWFEPFHFEHSDDMRFYPEAEESWMVVDDSLC